MEEVFALKCRSCGKKIRKGQELCPDCVRKLHNEDDSFRSEKYTDLMDSYVSTSRVGNTKHIHITPDLLAFTTFVIAAAILVITVILVTTERENITLELSDYVVIEYKGYNGFGQIDAHFDSDRFRNDCQSKLKSSSSEHAGAAGRKTDPSSLADLIIKNVNNKYSFNKTNGLRNGDTVRLRWDITEADVPVQLISDSGINMNGRNYTVAQLTETGMTDPFEGLSISYNGFSGSGSLEFTAKYPLVYTFSKTAELKNGDKLHVAVSAPYGDDLQSYCLDTIGSVLTSTESDVTVSGLPELKDFDPFDGINVLFSGVSGEGTASIEYKGDKDIRYNLNKTEGLYEGETVTVTAEAPYGYGLDEYCKNEYGLRPETTMKQFTVSGLGSYLTKLSDIDEITMNKLLDESDKAIKKDAADTQAKTEYQGMLLMNLKKGAESRNSWFASDDQDHMLLLVYKVTVPFSSGGKKSSFTYRTSCRFNNVIKLKNGTLRVNTDNVILPLSKVSPSGSTQKLSGFKDYNTLYDSLVRSKLSYYTVQSNVKEKLTETSKPSAS